jgi:hypothetical protein
VETVNGGVKYLSHYVERLNRGVHFVTPGIPSFKREAK